MKFQLMEGTLQLKEKIGKGTSATIWKAYLKSGGKNNLVIAKRIKKTKNEIIGAYKWKEAGMLVEPCNTKAPLKINYLNINSPSKSNLKKGECLLNVVSAKGPWNKDNAQEISLRTNYSTEIMIGKLLRKRVSPLLPSPVFCKIHAAFTSNYHHNIIMEDAGLELEANSYMLNLQQFQSVVCQCIIAIAWSQKIIQFKHHDLHGGNVYFNFENNLINNKWNLPDGDVFVLPSSNVSAVIADFGLSIANCNQTRIGRLDFSLLSTDDKKWGEWNYDLENNEGYDVIVLLEALRDECKGKHLQWLKNVFKEIRKLIPKLRISRIGRPLCSIKMKPEEFLNLPSFQFFSKINNTATINTTVYKTTEEANKTIEPAEFVLPQDLILNKEIILEMD
jgi:hypothetical protein